MGHLLGFSEDLLLRRQKGTFHQNQNHVFKSRKSRSCSSCIENKCCGRTYQSCMLLSNISVSRTGLKDENDKTSIKSELAKIMLAKPSQIEISDLFKDSNVKNKMEFVLSSRHLINDHENYVWNDLTEKIIKERETLLLTSVLLYRYVKNTKNFNLALNGNKYSIYGDSVTIELLNPSCLQNQRLLKNGFICGKLTRFQHYEKKVSKYGVCSGLYFPVCGLNP